VCIYNTGILLYLLSFFFSCFVAYIPHSNSMYNGHFGRPLKSIYARTKMASATHNNTLLCFLITRSTIIRRPRDLRGGIPARTYYTYVCILRDLRCLFRCRKDTKIKYAYIDDNSDGRIYIITAIRVPRSPQSA